MEYLLADGYQRTPRDEIMLCDKHETKKLIIARFGMLECGSNFKGSLKELCSHCDLDNENHRLNDCMKFRESNYYDNDEKVQFEKVYSNDMETIKDIIPKIEKTWNTKRAHGTMNK